MPEVQKLQAFDPAQPVYCIKSFFYGVSGSSVRHASDHPLRLDQIPAKYRTSEYIKQGRVKSTIPTMIVPEVKNEGLIFDERETTPGNPLNLPQDKDERGNVLPQSTPNSVRKSTKARVKEKKAVDGKAADKNAAK